VRSPAAIAAAAGSRFLVARSTSTTTGVTPAWMMALTVAANVSAVMITSSPGRTSSASIERGNAAVHELTATAWGVPS
jgi:hypothetical protein